MIVHGRNLLIYAGGSVVAAARTCRISMDFDTIEVAGVDSGQFKYHIQAMSSWTVTVTKLVAVVHTLFEENEQPVRLSFVVRDKYGNLMGDRMTGDALIKNVSVDATVGSLATGSITFQGTGELIREIVGLCDYDGTELYDYNGNSRLCAPSSNL